MKLLDFINQKTNNAYKDFKLVSVIFDEKNLECTFKFLYKDTIQENSRTELHSLISDYYGNDIKVVVKCKKAYVDSDLVRDIIFNFLTRNFNSLGINFDKNNICVSITDTINTTITCNSFQCKHIRNNMIDKEIVAYANSFFFEDFVLDIIHDHEDVEEDIIPTIEIDLSENKNNDFKFIKVENINNYIGEVVGNPINISSIKSAMENVEVVGQIKYITEKSFESKRKDKDGNSVNRKYYNFVIFYNNDRINCVYFPNKSDLTKIDSIEENSTVILHGDIEDFNGRLSFKVKSLAFCNIIENNENEIKSIDIIKEPNSRYLTVIPEPYIDIYQDNLFMEKQEIGQYLLDNDVVIFDVETTGLEASRCEIIEIGAVKVSKGKIIETFETLIKPTGEIPDEIIKLTGITPEMVVNSPSIKQVMPDFYKFCYGCTIMAYNIDFDYKFISIWGQKQGYEFDNKQIDVLYLARAFVPGLKNFKLSTVCKKLNVSLENAHRAVHDAMATAEVVIKLSPNIT